MSAESAAVTNRFVIESCRTKKNRNDDQRFCAEARAADHDISWMLHCDEWNNLSAVLAENLRLHFIQGKNLSATFAHY